MRWPNVKPIFQLGRRDSPWMWIFKKYGSPLQLNNYKGNPGRTA